jgi:hypothetical protein
MPATSELAGSVNPTVWLAPGCSGPTCTGGGRSAGGLSAGLTCIATLKALTLGVPPWLLTVGAPPWLLTTTLKVTD